MGRKPSLSAPAPDFSSSRIWSEGLTAEVSSPRLYGINQSEYMRAFKPTERVRSGVEELVDSSGPWPEDCRFESCPRLRTWDAFFVSVVLWKNSFLFRPLQTLFFFAWVTEDPIKEFPYYLNFRIPARISNSQVLYPIALRERINTSISHRLWSLREILPLRGSPIQPCHLSLYRFALLSNLTKHTWTSRDNGPWP